MAITVLEENRVYTYSDLDPEARVETSLSFDEDSVLREVNNYFATKSRQRLFRPLTGNTLWDHIFELDVTRGSSLVLYNKVVSELPDQVPRIEVMHDISMFIADPDNYRYIINLTFKIKEVSARTFRFDGFLLKNTHR